MNTSTSALSPARILVVAPQPFYEDRGTPIAVRQMLEALGELRYQVDLLTYPVGQSPAIPGVRYLRIPNPLKIRSVPIGFSWRKIWFDIFLFFALKRLLKQHTYHCVHAVEEAAFLAVFAARNTHTPVIYDMQSSMAEQLTHRPWLGSRILKPWLYACERWLIRHADYVVSSAGLAEQVRSVLPQARIRDWSYPSSSHQVAPEEVSKLRAQLGLDAHNRVILYTGNFAGYQGLPSLVDAMPNVLSAVPHAVLVLVGAEPSTEQPIREQLSRLLPADRYRIIPQQPKEAIHPYLALADVLVSPRKATSSNLPLKILEYLAAGKPIVATAIHAHKAILTNELAVLAEPTSEALAAAVIGILQDAGTVARLETATRRYAERYLRWIRFVQFIGELHQAAQRAHDRRRLGLLHEAAVGCRAHQDPAELVSVIIPARNTGPFISRVVSAVLAQQTSAKAMEVIIIDDGSTDNTAELARRAGAHVVISVPAEQAGNPAAARNLGAAHASGDPVVFLDADCTPAQGWLAALLQGHKAGAVCVGGSLAMPSGLSASARWDYFCGWYHAHERVAPGRVKHHPPCNLSVCRKAFLATRGFDEAQPIAYSHEELAWQAQLQRTGGTICFEPEAVAYHWNRRGVGNLLKRNYRWAYSAIESKAETRISRFAWAYRHPLLLSLASLLLAPVSAVYIVWRWLRARRVEPLVVFPVVLLARLVYGAGMCAGGLAWVKLRAANKSKFPLTGSVL